MVIYLDESGTITESDSKYFIVGSFTVGDPRRISKAFRKWQKSKFPPKTLFYTDAVDSTSSPQVQVADWISGALARYHEKKEIGDELYAALKKNIVEERELFSDYWSKKWK